MSGLLGFLRRLRPDRGNAVSISLLVALAAVVVAAAIAADGYRTPKMDLHDGGVWLSNAHDEQSGKAVVGRTNTQIKEVDVKVRLDTAAEIDLLQSDTVVLVHQPGGGNDSLIGVEARSAKPGGAVKIPVHSVVGLGPVLGDRATAAVLDPQRGQVWVGDSASILNLKVDSGKDDTKPTATVEGARGLVVGVDGVARVFSPKSGQITSFDMSGQNLGATSATAGREDHDLQYSSVGSTAVILDQTTSELLLPGRGPVDLSSFGENARLQLPGPAARGALVATDVGLLRVPLDGGAPQKLFDNGSQSAARPVYVRGCSYGAWAGSPKYVRVCDGLAPKAAPLPNLVSGRDIAFRTNRGKVVINQLDDGSSYLIDDANAEWVDWSQATTEADQKPDPNAPESKDEETQQSDPIEQAPIAREDHVATRPGRSVIVHPLDNDTDVNQDVLVVQSVDNVPQIKGLSVDVVNGGLAVQVTPPPQSTDTIVFGYTINDGRGKTASSTITVDIHPFESNLPPRLKDAGKQDETFVVAGASVTHNVLSAFEDPDGDAMSLVVPVELQQGQGTITAEATGVIVYTPPGLGFVGDVTIEFKVADDVDPELPTDGKLLVHVLPADHSNLPKARGDHASTVVGHEVIVDVLANDSDADGEPLRVTNVDQPAGVTTLIDAQNKVHVTPSQIPDGGTLNLHYSVTDGPHVVTGLLRVDVTTQPVQKPPVAVRDDVVLRPGVPAIVDVVQNDLDENGDVLIVRTVDAHASGLVVEVIDHRFLRIATSDGGLLPSTKSFSYTISDGQADAVGTVVVRPGPTATQDQPPRTNDDEVNVRAGNVATFDVLANDSDPEGGHLSLVLPPESELASLNLASRVFASNDMLRFIAPPDPTTLKVPYSAGDPAGNRSSAFVVVHVLPADLANNGPRPPDLSARTVAGRPIEIPIPVATIDPDGDDVTLLGLADTAPSHGSVTNTSFDRLTYLPDKFDGGFFGTDVFTYRVRDSHGAEATGTIRVGVAPPASVNSKPVAIDDVRQVSSGGQLSVNVIANDSDPDGDALALDTNAGLGTPPNAKFKASIEDGRIAFDAAGLKQGEQASITYTVTDGILTDTGLLKVTVAPQQNLPPVAQDDQDVAHAAAERVTFDVLKNDSDPDGTAGDLHITDVVGVDGASTADGGQRVTFVMPKTPVDLIYTVADAQGATARAVLRVAVLDGVRVRPIANYDEVSTKANTPVTYDVLANDTSSPGTTKHLLEVGEGRGGQCALAGDKVTFTPTAAFAGVGGCSYTLGDGSGDAPDTLRAIGMLGVTVKRDGNTKPTFVEQPIVVTADSETRVDLRPAVSDPDEGDLDHLSFTGISGETGVVTASFEGTTIVIKATTDAVEGTVVPLTFKVSDGHPDGTVDGKVSVSLHEYSGQLAVLAPDSFQTYQGISIPSLAVLANDQLAENKHPLQIISTTQPVGGTVIQRDSDLEFQPDPTFHGDTTFTYTVDDGTHQSKRQVTGTVTVTVIGRPDRPPAPSVTRESGAITLSWGVPPANGAPITSYSIKATGGSVNGPATRSSSTNSFRFDGLTNGQTYTFQIAAINAAVDAALKDGKLSEPEYSDPSPGIIPNAIPRVPDAPTAQFDPAGSAIKVTWHDPGGDGTPVTRYVLQISPPPEAGSPEQSFPAAGSTMSQTIGNLKNGTAYTFKVKAINQLSPTEEGDSGYSASSAPEVPATKPDAPAKPQVTEGDQKITVAWTQPNTNGDAIRSYDVEVSQNGSIVGVTHIADPSVHQTDVNTANGSSYTFRVRAENKAGWSDYSAPSDTAISSGKPFGVTDLSADVESGVGSGQARLIFSAPNSNGSAITSYEYRFDTNSSGSFSGWSVLAGSNIVSGLSNGVPYRFQVHACNKNGCSQTDSNTSTPAVVPYGNPNAPSVNSSVNGTQIHWFWNQPADNGRPFTRFDVYLDGGLVYQGGNTTYDGNFGYSQSHTLTVYTIANAADASRTASAPANNTNRTVDPPQPTLNVHQGNSSLAQSGSSGDGSCTSAGCSYLEITFSNFSGGSHQYACYTSNGGKFYPGSGTATGPSGSSGTNVQLGCWADASVYGGVYVVMDGVKSNTASW